MGTEVLLAACAGTAAGLIASFVAGWALRGKVASAVEALYDKRVGNLERDVSDLLDSAKRAQAAAQGVLSAANRRADHDPLADPRGLGLLLGASGGLDVPIPPRGEALALGDGGDISGDPSARPSPLAGSGALGEG